MRIVYIARILDHEKCGDYNLLDSVASPKAGPACFSPKAILRQNNGSTRFFLVTLTYADKKKADTLFYAENKIEGTPILKLAMVQR